MKAKDKEGLTVARLYRDKCKGCGKCVKVCKYLARLHGKAILWQFYCNGCGKCVKVCEHGAIGIIPYKSPY